MATKIDLFEDMAIALESWASASTEAITRQNADLQWVETDEPYRKMQAVLAERGVDALAVKKIFSECLRGFAVSVLTAFDGGTALSEKGRIYLVDEQSVKLGEGLHDDFVAYLLKTGRLT
jgi:hypothetical protein